MYNLVTTFVADETGAISVDWLILTAALVGLGLSVIETASGGLTAVTDDINLLLKPQGDSAIE